MNWISDYALYTSGNEAPSIFHLWCSLSCLASAAQRKIWLDQGYYKACTNLYIVLVAEPGRCKKSTAINLTRRLVSTVEEIPTKSDSITKEAIFKTMQDTAQTTMMSQTEGLTHCSLTVYAGEMSVFVKRGDKDFIGALNALFDTIDDLAFKSSTKTQGESVIMNPFLNILCGTTPQWLAENIQEDVIEGGFSSRTLVVYSDTPNDPAPRPVLTPAQKEAYIRLQIRLAQVAQLKGEFLFSDDAGEMYDSWYIPHTKGRAANLRLSGYHARKSLHLVKLAMLHSLSEKDELIITIKDLIWAEETLKMMEPGMELAFRGIGRNKLNSDMERILNDLKSRYGGKVRWKQLFADNVFQLKEMDFLEVMRYMATTGTVEIQEEKGTGVRWVVLKTI